MRKIEPDQKFLKPDAAVQNIDGEFAAAQHAVAIFELVGRNDLRGITLFGEKIRQLRMIARAA
jgi:hypothetical protein